MRSQNGIADIIRAELLRNYVGRKNAKHRRFLLFHCHNFEPKLTDREMRQIYSRFPFLGSCNKGIYVIDDPEEAEKKIQMEKSRRDSVDDKIELLKQHKAPEGARVGPDGFVWGELRWDMMVNHKAS